MVIPVPFMSATGLPILKVLCCEAAKAGAAGNHIPRRIAKINHFFTDTPP